MTVTTVLANMPSSPTDVAIPFLDQTKLVLRSAATSDNGLVQTSEYVYAAGDPNTETTVSFRVQTDPKALTVRSSMRLRTVQSVTVDSNLPVTGPVDFNISWTLPERSEDLAKLAAALGTAYALLMDGVTTKVPNTGILDMINRGLIQEIYG